jgi:hypothetical protein
MPATIVTLEDLQAFKRELIDEVKKVLAEQGPKPVKRWLKSNEVRRMLLISPGTLQNLRVNGTLPFTKIGGVMFYEYEDIRKMLEKNKRGNELDRFKR